MNMENQEVNLKKDKVENTLEIYSAQYEKIKNEDIEKAVEYLTNLISKIEQGNTNFLEGFSSEEVENIRVGLSKMLSKEEVGA